MYWIPLDESEGRVGVQYESWTSTKGRQAGTREAGQASHGGRASLVHVSGPDHDRAVQYGVRYSSVPGQGTRPGLVYYSAWPSTQSGLTYLRTDEY